jgi:hypothetical protein
VTPHGALVVTSSRGHGHGAAERCWIADGGVSVNVDNAEAGMPGPPRSSRDRDARSRDRPSRAVTPSRSRPASRHSGRAAQGTGDVTGVVSKRRAVKHSKRRRHTGAAAAVAGVASL